ncbi:MAG: shikimate dehydrogenase [Acidobacteria bacterium]|nr:shikimate dehydrogenase [Acidobacteriota bacterium]
MKKSPSPTEVDPSPETPRFPRLDGSIRLYGVVGDPIGQVKSPSGITAKFVERGANAILVPMHVQPADFDKFMDAARGLLNLEGLVVTAPHKMSVTRHLESVTSRARFLAAANVIRRVVPGGGWHGDASDGLGMLNALQAAGFDPRGKRVLLAGAGGAGSAIALAMIESGTAELALHDIRVDRRDTLIARLSERCAGSVCVGSPDPAGFDLTINATPLGMKADDPLPIHADRLAPGAFAADVVTVPARTRFLELAGARGCHTVPGLAMFEAQADFVADFLLDAPSCTARGQESADSGRHPRKADGRCARRPRTAHRNR